MKLKHEPYTIELDEAKWLAKALYADSDRHVLTMAALTYLEGAAVLAATDRYRLHILRLGPVSEEFPTRFVDLKRIVYDASYAAVPYIKIDLEYNSVAVGTVAKDTFTEISKVHTPVFDTVEGEYPDIARAIPKTRNPVSEIFAIDCRYLADATELFRRGGPTEILFPEGLE